MKFERRIAFADPSENPNDTFFTISFGIYYKISFGSVPENTSILCTLGNHEENFKKVSLGFELRITMQILVKILVKILVTILVILVEILVEILLKILVILFYNYMRNTSEFPSGTI